MSLVWGRVDLITKARRNRQFRCDPPRVPHKQHEAVGASVNLGGGIERCLGVFHLLQQEAGNGAASRQVASQKETGFTAGEIKISPLAPEKDGDVLRKAHFAAERAQGWHRKSW